MKKKTKKKPKTKKPEKTTIDNMRSAINRNAGAEVTALIENGFPINEPVFYEDDSTALHVAVDCSRSAMLRLLLDAGADPDVPRVQFGLTPLLLAIREGNLKCIEILLDAGASAHVVDDHGITALHYAARSTKARQLLPLLFAAGVECRQAPSGLSPLHEAARQNDPEVIRLLVKHGADVSATQQGDTPLMQAVSVFFHVKAMPSARKYRKPQLKIVEALIECGADPTDLFPSEIIGGPDAAGKPIVDYAIEMKLDKKLIAALTKGGATTKKTTKGTKMTATPTNRSAVKKKKK